MRKPQKIIGVILAAGKGSRMYPFSEKFPKPLLPIGNVPLLAYQIEMMRKIGIDEVVIVIGHFGFEVVKELGLGEKLGVKLKYIDQEKTLGIAHAMGLLEPYISTPFLLFLGDIFFVTNDLGKMIDEFNRGRANAVLATKIEKDREAIKKNFAIEMDKTGLVHRVIEKPRYILNNIKGCGLYLFDLHIFDAIRRTPRTAMRDEYEITDAIQILINDGYKVKALNMVREDVNLTCPEDLLYANLQELANRKKSRLIGENVSICDQRLVQNSIIGNNVKIEKPVKVVNSVVFSHTVIRSGEDIKNSIVTPDQRIQCSGEMQRVPVAHANVS
jgi:dTDP-glucose pyrophosphorylase